MMRFATKTALCAVISVFIGATAAHADSNYLPYYVQSTSQNQQSTSQNQQSTSQNQPSTFQNQPSTFQNHQSPPVPRVRQATDGDRSVPSPAPAQQRHLQSRPHLPSRR